MTTIRSFAIAAAMFALFAFTAAAYAEEAQPAAAATVLQPLVDDSVADQVINKIGEDADLLLLMKEDPRLDLGAFCVETCQYEFNVRAGRLALVAVLAAPADVYKVGRDATDDIWASEPTPAEFFANLRGDLQAHPEFIFGGSIGSPNS